MGEAALSADWSIAGGMTETPGETAKNRDSSRMMGALSVKVRQGCWRSLVDEAYEHEDAKTIKRAHRDKRSISASMVKRSRHHCGVGRRGCRSEGTVASSTDEKDEICVRKN